MTTEMEMKLRPRGNSQIKIKDKLDRPIVVERVRYLCTLFNISILSTTHIKQKDVYWDDKDASFFQKGYCVRVREKPSNNGESEFFYTLKAPKNVTSNGINRFEHEEKFNGQVFPYSGKSACIQKFADNLNANVTFITSDLKERLSVNNTRMAIKVKTAHQNTYTICFDKFYFVADDGDGPRHSDTFFEIEIESVGAGEEVGFDTDILKLSETVQQLFDCEESNESKYQLASKWAKGEVPGSYCFFAADIVSYSTFPAIRQKQAIKQLNFITKQQLKLAGLRLGEDYYYNNTGDGYILIFEAHTILKLMPAIGEIFREIEQYNKKNPKNALTLRYGLNHGIAFEYSDMKEDKNFAGGGINMVNRVMNIGTSDHILASVDFVHYLRDMGGSVENFTYLGKCTVKHGVELECYNYYSDVDAIGNSDVSSLNIK